MKILHLDCGMGAAGDMLTAALLELVDDPKMTVQKLNALQIPGVEYHSEPSEKCGIMGTHMSVTMNGEEEDAFFHHHHDAHDHNDEPHHHEHGENVHCHEEHDHGDGCLEHTHQEEHEEEHHHDHGEHHHHTGMAEIAHIVAHMPVSETVKADILAVYRLIAEAESHAHGKPAHEVHFHEVGAMDAIADVAAVCMLIDDLAPEKITATAVHVGSGHVHCAHGILPVPAPATAYILKDVPIYGGEINGELCTPTGAALLKHFVQEFGAMPVMKPSKIGYGMGKKDFPAANCVRALLGETTENAEKVSELHCNLDDMTAEDISFACDTLFENGALDVYTHTIGMKKGRTGTELICMCQPADKDKMLGLLFKHTSTLGVRETEYARHRLNRRGETRSTKYGDVRVKISEGFGVRREKAEHDDLERLARTHNVSVEEIRKSL